MKRQNGSREIEKSEAKIVLTLEIEVHNSRWIKSYRELSRIKKREIAIKIANEDLLRGVHCKRGLMD